MTDDAPEQTFAAAARALGRLGVAYLHIIEPGAAGDESRPAGAGGEPLGSGGSATTTRDG